MAVQSIEYSSLPIPQELHVFGRPERFWTTGISTGSWLYHTVFPVVTGLLVLGLCGLVFCVTQFKMIPLMHQLKDDHLLMIHGVNGVFALVALVLVVSPFWYRPKHFEQVSYALFPEMLALYEENTRAWSYVAWDRVKEFLSRTHAFDFAYLVLDDGKKLRLSSFVPQADEFYGEVEKRCLEAQLSQAVAQLEQGQSVSVGPFAFSAQGLQYQKKSTPWSAIQTMEVSPPSMHSYLLPGLLTIRTQAMLPLCSTHFRKLPNKGLIIELLKLLAPQAAGDLPVTYAQLRRVAISPRMVEAVTQHAEQHHQEKAQAETAEAWWVSILIGLLFGGIAVWLNYDLVRLENGEKEAVKVWWGIALAYNWLGRFGAVALVGVAGGVFIVAGVLSAMKPKATPQVRG